MEVFFSDFVNFFAYPSQKAEGHPQPMQEVRPHVGPKIPDGPQKAARGPQIEDRSQHRAQQHIEPQLTAEAQREPEKRHQYAQHVEAVQKVGQLPVLPPPQTDRAHQIVDQRLPHSQQHRGAEIRQLLPDIVLHALQLNRRRQREPRSTVSS